MVDALLERGYAVDVISYRNTTFRPRRHYDILFSARVHFDLIAGRLPRESINIVHLDTSHWLQNNAAALNRCLQVHRKRGVDLESCKLLEQSRTIDSADYATLLNNEVTYETYRFDRIPIFQVPNPTVCPWRAIRRSMRPSFGELSPSILTRTPPASLGCPRPMKARPSPP
jgi:hypothetical protein